MGKRKRVEGMEERWAGDAESVWSGMADWRAAHPKATFNEIEAALDERLDRLRARLLGDLALASAAADLQGAVGEERPRCKQCGRDLQARGLNDRTLLTQGGAEVRLRRSYASCSQCGDGTFPPG